MMKKLDKILFTIIVLGITIGLVGVLARNILLAVVGYGSCFISMLTLSLRGIWTN